MHSYRPYRNIRRRALIFGLPVGSFALLMASVILSLLLIIFSFHLGLLLALPIWNLALYLGLLRFQDISFSWPGTRGIRIITGKRQSLCSYED